MEPSLEISFKRDFIKEKIALLVTILVRGSPGASTEQKTIPISAILIIIFHHDESLNSKTALLLSCPVFLKNFLTISRFSNVYSYYGQLSSKYCSKY